MGVYLYPSNTETPLKAAYIGIPNPTSIVLDKNSINLTTVWDTEQLTATIEPSICDKSITWNSSDTTIATVSTTGLVTCVTPGTCTITATTVNGLTATCWVTNQQWWQPWANTIWYYTMDNDILNHATTGSTFPDWVLNTAVFSTARVHWSNTYSLYCDSNTYAYLPASSEFVFWTNDLTLSFWVYSETNSWGYMWMICNYYSSNDHNNWWRVTDRHWSVNKLGFCYKWSSYVDDVSNTSIYNDWWHNVVLTRDSGKFYLYLDGSLLISDTSHTSFSMWRNAKLTFWLNVADGTYSKIYLNDVIFENVAWSAQDVSDYYNLTNI